MNKLTIGRFTVSIELDKVVSDLKYYDVCLDKGHTQVKIHKGCIGEKSVEYWSGRCIELAERLNILYDLQPTEVVTKWIGELLKGGF